jgi:aquaporin Z
MFFDKRLGAGDMVAYGLAQLAGAVLGSLCVLIAFDQDAVKLTATLPGGQGAGTALFLEILATAIFVIVILHSTKGERHRGTALVAISLTLAAANLALAPFSGASLNTARSFGPALIGSEWTDFWVYIVGPLAGAILGWVVYAVVVKAPEEQATS